MRAALPALRRNLEKRAPIRGVTLVETLVVIALLAIVTGIAVSSMGILRSARLKRSSIMIVSAVRVAYTHANVLSKPVRLVFDLEQNTLTMEESSQESFSSFFLDKKDTKTGGAAAVTESEREAQEKVDAIMKGPRPPKPAFKPTKAFGFDPENGKGSKELEGGIRFVQVETAHQEEPAKEGRAYLYFWPGGQTERAAIQLGIGTTPEDSDVMTVMISPLSGKTKIEKGRVAMPRPADEREESQGDRDM
jgi:general secretion pathway protein H